MGITTYIRYNCLRKRVSLSVCLVKDSFLLHKDTSVGTPFIRSRNRSFTENLTTYTNSVALFDDSNVIRFTNDTDFLLKFIISKLRPDKSIKCVAFLNTDKKLGISVHT